MPDTKEKTAQRLFKQMIRTRKQLRPALRIKDLFRQMLNPSASATAKSKVKMQMPVQGKVYRILSLTARVLFRAQEWTTHDGIDLNTGWEAK